MSRQEKLVFDKYAVVIDPENLRFDEDSLTTYIQRESGFYDNFGAFLALAERNLQNKEVSYERLFSERFVEAKESGSSDKLAEAKAKADPDVSTTKETIVEARYVVNRLKNHLKAWDKNHDNAQSMGHMLRKQMDKLNGDIMGRIHGDYGSHATPNLDKDVEETVSGGFDDLDSSNMRY